MGIKLRLTEYCDRCGAKQATKTGDRVWYNHQCPNAPPGPVEPPKNFHINEIIFIEGNKMIPIDDMIIGARYRGEGRNFDFGTWTGEGFSGKRYKFGQMIDVELHWLADRRYGTFKPFVVTKYPDTLEGALARLRDAVRQLIADIKEALPWHKII